MRRSFQENDPPGGQVYGYVLVRLSGTRTGELLEAVAARCEHLVHAAISDPALRLRQRRLIGIALVAPFPAAAAVAVLLTPHIGTMASLAAVGAIFLVPFSIAAMIGVTGRSALAQTMLLVFGTAVASAVIAAAGGASSPVALVVCALVFETWWAGRTTKAAVVGLGAALGALVLQAGIGLRLPAGPEGISPAHWIVPIACVALIVPRLAAWLEEENGTEVVGTLENVIEAVVMHMDLSGEVTDASHQARRIIGLPPELLLSGGVFERMHVADRVGYLCALADLRAAAGFRRVDVRLRVPGSQGQAACDFRPFTLELMRSSEEDKLITMLLRADQPTRAASTPGADADDTAHRNIRVLAAVSHELRTPLNSIIGFSDMLLHGACGSFSDPRQEEYVGLVKESGSHLLSVVNAILDASRIETGAFTIKPEAFSFPDTVEACRHMLAQQAAQKGIELKADIPAETGMLHADKRATKQILINLLSNAIKFTPSGGSVTISAHRSGSHLHFRVADTGIGMGEGGLARIGQPFVQLADDRSAGTEGVGLGLSLVKGLVALHKGAMSIESEPGRGTTVTIGLPVDQQAHSAIDLAEIRAKPADRPRETNYVTFRKTA